MHGSSTQYEATVRMQVKLSFDYKRTNPSHSHLGSAGCVCFIELGPCTTEYSIYTSMPRHGLNMYRPHRTCLYLGKWIDLLLARTSGCQLYRVLVHSIATMNANIRRTIVQCERKNCHHLPCVLPLNRAMHPGPSFLYRTWYSTVSHSTVQYHTVLNHDRLVESG